MKRALVMATAAALSGALGCAQPEPKVAGDVAADREAITALREREINLFGSGNVDSVLAVLTDDVVIMPPNEPALVGKEAARSWYQNVIQQFEIEGTYTSASDLTINGDWAFERMAFALKFTPTGGGAAIEDVGKGFHVYRRQGDGSWKIAQDIWNSDKPVPAGR
jgi:ketosteroid isomerase-like protein